MADAKLTKLLQQAETVAGYLEQHEELITDEFRVDFVETCHRLQKNADDIINPDRCLRIGIVGKVKAGKSSFLNALLFDGADVLPKAATPMTAGLTRIVYAEQPYARVEYYTEQDWQGVEAGAAKYDETFLRLKEQRLAEKRALEEQRAGRLKGKFTKLTVTLTDRDIENVKKEIIPEYQACKELAEMVARDPSITEKLGTTEDIAFEELATYIGSQGRFSPVVKSIEVGIDLPGVKDLEVIDTPGLNDPIVSRSQRTKDFLMKCDLVIMLSRASQFLDSADLGLLVDTLPSNGIERIRVVASKFDSVLLDTPGREVMDIRRAIQMAQRKLIEGARVTVTQKLHDSQRTLGAQRILENFAENSELRFVISIAYSAASRLKREEPLSSEERVVVDNLRRRFSGIEESAEFLEALAGIDNFRAKEFAPLRATREEVLAERAGNFIREQRLTLLKKLDTIVAEARSSQRRLQEGDIEKLKAQREAAGLAVDSMRRRIADEFGLFGAESRKRLRAMTDDVKRLAQNYKDIKVNERKDVRHHHKHHWFRKDEDWDTVTYTQEASVSDVVDNIENYIDCVDETIHSSTDRIIDTHDVKRKISEHVLKAFADTGIDFAAEDIERPLELRLEQWKLPPLHLLDRAKYQQEVASSFYSTVVEDSDIHRLASKQSSVMSAIKDDIESAVENWSAELTGELDELAVTFCDDFGRHITGGIEQLESQLATREASLASYAALIKALTDYKSELRALDAKE